MNTGKDEKRHHHPVKNGEHSAQRIGEVRPWHRFSLQACMGTCSLPAFFLFLIEERKRVEFGMKVRMDDAKKILLIDRDDSRKETGV
jgi:hypothetical protein